MAAQVKTCEGCGLETLTPVHRNSLPWHVECLKRDNDWTRAERRANELAHALLTPNVAASYTREEYAALSPEVRALARSQHWDDIRPQTGKIGTPRATGSRQEPQTVSGRYLQSLDALAANGAEPLAEPRSTFRRSRSTDGAPEPFTEGSGQSGAESAGVTHVRQTRRSTSLATLAWTDPDAPRLGDPEAPYRDPVDSLTARDRARLPVARQIEALALSRLSPAEGEFYRFWFIEGPLPMSHRRARRALVLGQSTISQRLTCVKTAISQARSEILDEGGND